MARVADKRHRLTIDVSPELRRRIKVAAATHDVSIREYVVGILERAIPHAGEDGGSTGRKVTPSTLDQLQVTRDAVMRGRTFIDDSTDLIEEARRSRIAEL